jgi:hypothetical protein
MTYIGAIMSYRGIKNVNKSINKVKAFREIKDWLADNYTDIMHGTHKKYRDIDSLNDMRDYIQEQDRQKKEQEHRVILKKVLDKFKINNVTLSKEELDLLEAQPVDILNSLVDEMTNSDQIASLRSYDASEQSRLFDLVRKLREAREIPFKYSNDVQDVIAQTNWQLPADKYVLKQIGKDQHHCVGGYGDKIRSHSCLILTKPNKTAEIQLQVKRDGTIESANINQVRGPSNAVLEPDDELKQIASALVGKNVKGDDAEKILSDIFAKHIIRPVPQHIMNAVHARF